MAQSKNQQLFFVTLNVWDSPAQYSVMRLIVDSEHVGRGYAFPSRRKMARTVGLDHNYVKRVIHQLEEKEALDRIGVDREHGARNRYVITLERAIAKARHEAGVSSDVPLWKLPPRSEVRKRLRQARADQGSSHESVKTHVGDPGIPPVSESRSIDRGEMGGRTNRGGGSPRPQEGDPGIPVGGIPGSPLIFPTSVLDLHDEVADADAPAASPTNQKIPGLLGDRSTPPVDVAARDARTKRKSALYHRVAGYAREILNAPPELGTELNGDSPITTEAHLVEATKWLSARRRCEGYDEVLHGACASEWFKFWTLGRRHANGNRE